jgi:hypothetical protein
MYEFILPLLTISFLFNGLISISPSLSRDIITTIKTIEGPYFATILVPTVPFTIQLKRGPPLFFLLSDIHVGRRKCDECMVSKGCYSLYTPSTFMEFHNEYARQYSIQSDLLTESWFDEEMRQMTFDFGLSFEGTNKSALKDVIYSNKPCMSHKKENCPLPDMRIHMGDTRQIDIHTNKYNGDMLLSYLIHNESIEYLLSLPIITVDRIISYKTMLLENYPDFEPDYIIRFLQKLLTYEIHSLDYFDEPFVQKYSRTYHEWKQVPEFIRDTFYQKGIDFYKSKRRPSTRKYYQYQVNRIMECILMNKECTSGIKVDADITMFMVDIYTISRSLKTFRNGRPSQLSIIYLGGTHIEAIMYLLEPYYTSIKSYGKRHLMTDELFVANKCISSI